MTRTTLASLLVTSLALSATTPASAAPKKRPAKKGAPAEPPAPTPDVPPAPEGSALGDPADASAPPPAPQTPAAPPPKPASKEAKAQAKALQKEATLLYNVQKYAEAADKYQAAYLLDPNPAYLYASAQSQRLGGDCTKALQSYQAYLRANPPESERAKANANIERCEQEIREREAAVNADQIQAPVDIPAPPPPPPPVEIVVPPPPPPPPEKSYLVGHVLLGLGVVVMGGGSYLYYTGRSDLQAHNDAASYDEYVAGLSDVDGAQTNQTLGLITAGAGLALVGGAIAYYVLRSSSTESPPPVQANVSAGGATVSYSLTF